GFTGGWRDSTRDGLDCMHTLLLASWMWKPCGVVGREEGSGTQRLLASTASQAHGSSSWHGMESALSTSASPRGGQWHWSSPRVLHASVRWIGMHSNLFVTLPHEYVGMISAITR